MTVSVAIITFFILILLTTCIYISRLNLTLNEPFGNMTVFRTSNSYKSYPPPHSVGSSETATAHAPASSNGCADEAILKNLGAGQPTGGDLFNAASSETEAVYKPLGDFTALDDSIQHDNILEDGLIIYSSKFVSGHAPYLGILRLKNRPTTCDLGYRVYRGPRVRHCRHFLNCPSVANSPSQRASALVESLVHGSSKDVPPPLQSASLIGLLDDPVDL